MGWSELDRPGGDATDHLAKRRACSKRLGVFRELVPTVSRYFRPSKPTLELAAPFVKNLEHADEALNQLLLLVEQRRASWLFECRRKRAIFIAIGAPDLGDATQVILRLVAITLLDLRI